MLVRLEPREAVMTSHLVVRAGLFVLLGALLSVFELASLRANVRLYLGGRSRAWAIAVHVLRLVLVASVLVIVARAADGPSLLATFVGFLLSRFVVAPRLGGTGS